MLGLGRGRGQMVRRVVWLLALWASDAHATTRTYSRFADFRAHLLSRIGAAKKSIVLVTDYLSDGEIVTALYLAKYRNLAVQVYLGPRLAGHYLSRLHYLKQQKIPTYLTPKSLQYPSMRTIASFDGSIIASDSSLDHQAKRNSFTWRQVPEPKANALRMQMKTALFNPTPAVATPRQLTNPPRPSARQKLPRITPSPQKGGYNYNVTTSVSKTAPKGVPTELPKKTKYQKNQMQKVEDSLTDPQENF